MVKRYLPTKTLLKKNTPASDVAVCRETPVISFNRVTAASGTAAPPESVTVPESVPVVSCAGRLGAEPSNNRSSVVISVMRTEILRYEKSFSGMTSGFVAMARAPSTKDFPISKILISFRTTALPSFSHSRPQSAKDNLTIDSTPPHKLQQTPHEESHETHSTYHF